jgi:DNA-binding NarL/FixJ family response regulator
MTYGLDRVPIDQAPAGTLDLERGRLPEEPEGQGAFEAVGAKVGRFIAVIENRTFLRECIRRSAQLALPLPIIPYSTVLELEQRHFPASPEIVILSFTDADSEAGFNALNNLLRLLPGIPIVVLAEKNDSELARTAFRNGAKGYIPFTMGFDIAVEAVRFVLAGGTYVPMDCLLAANCSGGAAPQSAGRVTSRELAVARAIWQGKSNKVIAYDLNMCESTVKVHVRNIMKKLKAKNRTEVAIKTRTVFDPHAGSQYRFESSASSNFDH